jgi:crossover junction endodeoxyribonuclease RuvC
MRILGIDPGTRFMGWGMVDYGGTERLGPFGCIRPKGTDMAVRLGQIDQQLSDIIQQHQPKIMVLETVFVNINPQSALTLGYSRGVAMAVAARHGLNIAEYAPNTIKKSLTGYGHATKDQMMAMIGRLFGVNMASDTADALAGALCHARHIPFLQHNL